MTTIPAHWANAIATTFAWDEALEALYDSWHRRVAAAERGHRTMADRLRRRHVTMGVSVAFLTLATSAGAFLSLRDTETTISTGGFEPDVVLLVVGSIGVLAALLVAAQTFLRSAAAAEGHRIAAVRYEALRREMATTLARPRETRDQPDLILTATRLRIDRYARESPAIGGRLWRKLEGDYGLSRPAADLVPRAPAIVIPEAPAG
jgi:hypothetical protein